MSPNFEKIKRFYNLGLYTKQQVLQFYSKGAISTKEYEQITGEQR